MGDVIPLKRTKEFANLKSIRLFNPKTEKTFVFCYCESREIESMFKEGWEIAKIQKTIGELLSDLPKRNTK